MNCWLAAFLRLFFRLLYNEFAWAYDLVAWIVSAGRWKSWVFACLPYLEGPRVLELGQGPGYLQVALAEKGLLVFGIDASPQMARQAASRLRRKGCQPCLVIGKAPDLPFPENHFDQIVATFPTEYIFQPDSLAEIVRLLRPGGSLVLVPVAWITGRGWLDRLAACLFHTTGQAPTWEASHLIPFTQAGLTASSQRIDLGSSQVMVILGRKP